MDKFGKSQPIKRVEDVRFVTGDGQYVDDITLDTALHAYFLRSSVAHGHIQSLDISAAEASEGVKLVLTADRLRAEGVEIGMVGVRIKNQDGSQAAGPMRPLLATGKVRFVGEPIAMIVAETRDQARRAAEAIEIEIDPIPAHVALATGGEQIHGDVPDNLAFDYGNGDAAAVDAAIATAAHVVTRRIDDNRIIVASMEPRGATADWDGARLHYAYNGQGVWGMKGDLARHLDLKPEQVHVTTPDVGGGFGMKSFTYPENIPVAKAAILLGQPVRWMSDRSEAMLADNGGRDLYTDCTLAFDADHKIVAYKVTGLSNLGAYNSGFAQAIQTNLFDRVICGTYDIQTVFHQMTGIYTNTAPVDAYRGAGRPEAIYALERMMDYAARQLGVDGFALRRKNFIPVEAFPYDTATGETYDVGDFNRVLSRVEDYADRAGYEARRAASASAGMLRGIGLCYYIESILGDPNETAKVAFHDDGTASIYVGTQSNGQGHETVFAQFLSDQTGIPADKIRVVQGDSDLIAKGGGTGGSRSVTTQTNATLVVVDKLVTSFSAFLAEELDTAPEEVSFDDENFRIEGRNEVFTFLEAADLARTKGREDLLVQEATGTLPGRSFPNGAHLAEVEIDPETGAVRVDRYTVTDDFGNLINPMLAEGQVHGGVAQGIGQAITERVVFDESGQMLTASFMDYGMPRADDVPMVAFHSEPVPSTANQLGMKGCGEAGTVGALAAVANAVLDAVAPHGVEQVDMPFTPERMWTYLQSKQAAE